MMHLTHLREGAISLRETLPKAQFTRGQDIAARTCSSEAAACQPGDVFFAITTADDDGHEWAGQAIERGATAVVAERLLPVDVPQVLVRDSRVAFARVCQALAGNPSQALTTIGVTGTAGKTVTAMLIASVFEAAGRSAGVMSSIGHSDSISQVAGPMGTPTAPEFATWMARTQIAGATGAVLELSSQALAEHRASGIELDAAILTNIKSDHLDEHNSARAYQEIKQRIFRMLKPGGMAIVNADDHRCSNLVGEIESPCLTYGLHAEADISAQVLQRHLSEQTFLIRTGNTSAPVRTRMIGDHHVSNCLAATAVGLGLGLELETIVRGLEAVERVPGRLERLECGQPFGVFVDAAASPETLALTIKTVRQVTSGRVLVVFGGHPKTSAARRAHLGRVLERGAHLPIVTSWLGRERNPLACAHDFLDGFNRPHKAQIIPDRREAIRFALSEAQPGDCVLIAGREHGAGAVSGRQKLADDREIACEWLYSSAEPPAARPRFRVVG